MSILFWAIPAIFCLMNACILYRLFGKDFVRTRGDLALVVFVSLVPLVNVLVSFAVFLLWWSCFMNSERYKKIVEFFDKEL